MALTKKKKVIIGIVTLVVLSGIVIGSILASNKEQTEVTTQKIETRNELRSLVTASGEVRPIQYINLTSEVQGRIEEIYVKEGDQVTKGQPLVRLDPTQLDSNKDAQYATLQASLNDVQSARTEVQSANTQELTAVNGITQAQQSLLAAEAGVATARQGVNVAQTQIDQAQSQINRAQTEVDRAQVGVNTAQRELKRTAELVESGVASRSEYDAAKDNLENAQVALRTANATLQTSRAALQTSKEQLQQQKIAVEESKARANQQRVGVREAEIGVKRARSGVERARSGVTASENRAQSQQALLRGQTSQRDKTMQVAPLNGVIAEIPSKVGTFATAGLSTTPLLTIADMSQVNIEVKVDETEIDKVAVGQEAKVKVDAFQDKEIKGQVVQKTPLAVGKSQTSGGLSNNINVQEAKEFRVVVKLEELPKEILEGLRPGMSATATITTKTQKNVIAVPLQAIVEKDPNENQNANVPNDKNSTPAEKPKRIKGVYLLEGEKVKFSAIETGITGESDIEVLSGVQSGAEVVTGPSKNLKDLKDGDAVKRKTFKPGENNNSGSK